MWNLKRHWNTDQWTFTIVFLWSIFIVAHWFFKNLKSMKRWTSEEYFCVSRDLRNDFFYCVKFLFLMLFYHSCLCFAAITHLSHSLRGQQEEMFPSASATTKATQKVRSRTCLPMTTINILMRNANELTSRWYKSSRVRGQQPERHCNSVPKNSQRQKAAEKCQWVRFFHFTFFLFVSAEQQKKRTI